MQKLPEEFRIAITRNLGSETWNLKDILSEFHKELQLREQCLLNTKELRPSSSSQRGESLHSTSALFSNSSKDKKVARVWCSFCNQDHQSSSCNVVRSPESRKQILKRKGKCFLCLKTEHLSRNCQSSVKCFKCHGPHHVTIVTALISPRQAKPKVKMYPVYPPACMWISLRDQSSYRLQLPKCYALIMTVAPEVFV